MLGGEAGEELLAEIARAKCRSRQGSEAMPHQVKSVREVVIARVDHVIDRVDERLVEDLEAQRANPIFRTYLVVEPARDHDCAGGVAQVLLRVPYDANLTLKDLIRDPENSVVRRLQTTD